MPRGPAAAAPALRPATRLVERRPTAASPSRSFRTRESKAIAAVAHDGSMVAGADRQPARDDRLGAGGKLIMWSIVLMIFTFMIMEVFGLSAMLGFGDMYYDEG